MRRATARLPRGSGRRHGFRTAHSRTDHRARPISGWHCIAARDGTLAIWALPAGSRDAGVFWAVLVRHPVWAATMPPCTTAGATRCRAWGYTARRRGATMGCSRRARGLRPQSTTGTRPWSPRGCMPCAGGGRRRRCLAVFRRAVGRRPVCARQARSCLGYGARGCGAGRLYGIARMPARAAHAQDLPQVRRA